MVTGTIRLLIVDDQEAERAMLRILFEDRPYEIAEAFNGDEAVEKIQAADFDIVLLDMRMPTGTEGLEALTEIKRIKPRTVVIMVSAYGDIRKAVAAIKSGAENFVERGKPEYRDLVTFEVDKAVRRVLTERERDTLREEVIRTNFEIAQTAKDANKKGKALEVLMTAVFNSIDGFTATSGEQNSTEQIDIFITNRSSDEFWRKEKQFFVAECKNWSKKVVGSPVLSRLETNIRNRSGRCSLGFLVLLKLVAKTIKDDMRGLRRESILIVPIDGKRLRRLVEATPVERDRLLQDFVREAASS